MIFDTRLPGDKAGPMTEREARSVVRLALADLTRRYIIRPDAEEAAVSAVMGIEEASKQLEAIESAIDARILLR